MTQRAVVQVASISGAPWMRHGAHATRHGSTGVRRNYGSEPIVQYFETPLVADNVIGKTIDEAGDGGEE